MGSERMTDAEFYEEANELAELRAKIKLMKAHIAECPAPTAEKERGE